MKQNVGKAVKIAVLTVGAFVMIFPFLWMLFTSLKTLPEAISIPPQWMPETPQWKNYEYSWNLVPFAMFFRNTIWVGILSVVVTLAFSILGAYAFSIYSFPGRNLCFYLFMLTMMVPSEILIIQNYVTCSRLGLLDSFSGIVLPTVANGFYIFMLQEYFMQTPPSLFKAAKVDGCSNLKFIVKILLPLTKSAIGAMAVYTFINAWNMYMWPLLVTGSNNMRTVQIGISMLDSVDSQSITLMIAGVVMIIIPSISIFIIGQKQLIRGMFSGAVKG